jgi:hypothetical protein
MPLRSSTPPSLLRAGDEGNVFHARGRVEEAVRRHAEAGGVGHRRAFYRRLGAVEKAVEHLRVEPAAQRLLGREAVVAPHGLGRRFGEVRQPLVAAPGRHHRKAAGARPVDQVADQRGLVAEGQRIDHARLLRLVREQGAAEGVGLDRHVDHVLAVREGIEAVVDGGDGVAGALDHDVDGRLARHGLPVVGDPGGAGLQGFLHRAARRRARASSPRVRGSRGPHRATGRQSPPAARRACAAICARYIEPNLPAPIRPMRMGRPSAARCCRRV